MSPPLATPTTILSDSQLREELVAFKEALDDERQINIQQRAAHDNAPSSYAKQQGRVEALQRLETIVVSLASEGWDVSLRPPFKSLASRCFKGPLLRQLVGTQNRVTIAACNLIEVFYRHTSDASIQERCSNSFMQPLLNITASSSERVSAAAAAAIRALLCRPFGSEAFGVVVKAVSTGKHANTRYHALHALLYSIHHVKGTTQNRVLNNYLNAIALALPPALGDANPNVRQMAILCYWTLHLLAPSVTEGVLARLSKVLQQQVLQARERSLASVGVITRSSDVPPALPSHVDSSSIEMMAGATSVGDEISAVKARAARRFAESARRRQERAHHADPAGRLMSSPLIGGGDGSVDRISAAAVCYSVPTPPNGNNKDHHRVGVSPATYKELWSQINSSDWVTREAGLDFLQAREDWERCVAEGRGEEALVLVVRRMGDTNRRVEMKALKSMQCLAETMRAHQACEARMKKPMRQQLPSLFVVLLQSTMRKKPAAERDVWLSVLVHLLALHSPPELLSSAMRGITEVVSWEAHAMIAVKARLVELVQFLITRYSPVLAAEDPMWLSREVLPGLVTLLPGLRGEPHHVPATHRAVMESALSGAFYTSFYVTPRGFLQAYNALPAETRDAICRCVERRYPLLCDCLTTVTAAGALQNSPENSAGIARATTSPKGDFVLPPSNTLADQIMWFLKQSAQRSSGITQLPYESSGVCPNRSEAKKKSIKDPHRHRSGPSDSVIALHASDPGRAVSRYPLFSSSLTPQYLLESFNVLSPSGTLTAASTRKAEARMSATAALQDYRERIAAAHHVTCGAMPSYSVSGVSLATALVDDLSLYKTLSERERCDLLEMICCHVQRDATSWVEEALFLRLFRLLQRLGSEESETHHRVRRRVFSVLRALLVSNPIQSLLPPLCEHVLLLCRCGMDDAFAEVQQEAADLMQIVLHTPRIPLDTVLNGLTAALSRWTAVPLCLFCSEGWLELLNGMGRMFERGLWRGEDDASTRDECVRPRSAITRGVAQRLIDVLHSLLGHVVSRVRHRTLLVLAVVRWAVKETGPMMAERLSAAQMKLVERYIAALPFIH